MDCENRYRDDDQESYPQKDLHGFLPPLGICFSCRRLPRLRRNKKTFRIRRKRRLGEKVLGRQPLTCEIQTSNILAMTPISRSADRAFLKERIPRLSNPTVSSVNAATMAHSLAGEPILSTDWKNKNQKSQSAFGSSWSPPSREWTSEPSSPSRLPCFG